MTPLLLALSFLRFDIATGRAEQQGFTAAPIAIGSLAKPFVALAYARAHEFHYPKVKCRRCWRPNGHGELGIEAAIAQSCNTYFDTLRASVPASQVAAVAQEFGLPSLDRATPEALVRAYVELLRRQAEPGVPPILEGMRRAAVDGTARELGLEAIAKTGTASCSHRPKAPGDGFALVLYPRESPRTVLLVRLHGRPGSHAARQARNLIQ